MLYLTAKNGAPQQTQIALALGELNVGMLLGPAEKWQTPDNRPYDCDNGVYAAWIRCGRAWEQHAHEEWMAMHARVISADLDGYFYRRRIGEAIVQWREYGR